MSRFLLRSLSSLPVHPSLSHLISLSLPLSFFRPLSLSICLPLSYIQLTNLVLFYSLQFLVPLTVCYCHHSCSSCKTGTFLHRERKCVWVYACAISKEPFDSILTPPWLLHRSAPVVKARTDICALGGYKGRWLSGIAVMFVYVCVCP